MNIVLSSSNNTHLIYSIHKCSYPNEHACLYCMTKEHPKIKNKRDDNGI